MQNQARELAAQQGISIDQLIATSLAEKMAALPTGEYLGERAAHGAQRKFERMLQESARPTALPGDERWAPRSHDVIPDHEWARDSL